MHTLCGWCVRGDVGVDVVGYTGCVEDMSRWWWCLRWVGDGESVGDRPWATDAVLGTRRASL